MRPSRVRPATGTGLRADVLWTTERTQQRVCGRLPQLGKPSDGRLHIDRATANGVTIKMRSSDERRVSLVVRGLPGFDAGGRRCQKPRPSKPSAATGRFRRSRGSAAKYQRRREWPRLAYEFKMKMPDIPGDAS